MSNITLSPNASGTGTFTLASPNSNTNRTLDLPDADGTVILNSSDIESQVKTATNATGSAPIYSCRAWVNFDGTTNVGGFCTIRASGNVSSVADNGTGDYTVNFTTALPDANYSVSYSTGLSGGSSSTMFTRDDLTARTSSLFRINVRNLSTVAGDSSNVNCTVHR